MSMDKQRDWTDRSGHRIDDSPCDSTRSVSVIWM